jgi:hypothetical protein
MTSNHPQFLFEKEGGRKSSAIPIKGAGKKFPLLAKGED